MGRLVERATGADSRPCRARPICCGYCIYRIYRVFFSMNSIL